MTIPVIFSTGSLYPFGLDRSYGWAAEAGYDGVEIMMDERWDTVQDAYLNYLIEKHGISILALHTPLHGGVWRLDPEETLVRSARLAVKVGASLVVVHPPPPGRPLARWAAGPLERTRGEGVRIAVENMPRGLPKYAFSIRRNRSCHLPEHLFGIGDVTLDTSHVGASGLDLMQVCTTSSRVSFATFTSPTRTSPAVTSTGYPVGASSHLRSSSPPSNGMVILGL